MAGNGFHDPGFDLCLGVADVRVDPALDTDPQRLFEGESAVLCLAEVGEDSPQPAVGEDEPIMFIPQGEPVRHALDGIQKPPVRRRSPLLGFGFRRDVGAGAAIAERCRCRDSREKCRRHRTPAFR